VLCAGLQLILNVNQDEYISEGDDAAGMRIVIHQAQRMPFPEDEGLAINPGQTTSIGLRRVNCPLSAYSDRCVLHVFYLFIFTARRYISRGISQCPSVCLSVYPVFNRNG